MEKENDWQFLQYKLDDEGFDYCFDGYSDWKEIEDKEFHKLRRKYVAAKRKFEKFLEKKLDNL